MKNIYKKYDIRAPRYTSYPPMPFWNNSMGESDWLCGLENAVNTGAYLDGYVHVPFCEKLCWYCGCNRVITKDKAKASAYVDLLIGEFDLYVKRLRRPVFRSLHFGGGTPNFLKPQDLERLLVRLSPYFCDNGFEGSVEIDPRTFSSEFLQVLKGFGFSRVSLGVQDFNLKVQESINRVQPYELVANTLEMAKAAGLNNANLDLIWGLPNQTEETIIETISKVKELAPERISFYSYAHMPSLFKHQRLIQESDILRGEKKRLLYEAGRKAMLEAGYIEVGMDHYALKGSNLAKASLEKRLWRNFMGYTDIRSPNLLGLGASSISNCPSGFVQNHKGLKEYENSITNKALPISKSHIMKGEDELRSRVMQRLMCNLEIKRAEVEALSNKVELCALLRDMSQDGLLCSTSSGWAVEEAGRPFIRTIASSFDQYFNATAEERFSRSV